MLKLAPSIDPNAARMLLQLCIETDAHEAIGETTANRFAILSEKSNAEIAMPEPKISEPPKPVNVDLNLSQSIEKAQLVAKNCNSLEELRKAMAAYPHCKLREQAKNLVFSDGTPQARVMLVGEAPGNDEDRQGKPFVGRSGQLLDKMFAEIGLKRDHENPNDGFYLTNIIPWRPPGNRNPNNEEIAMMSPFVFRHIDIIKPAILVAVGNVSCQVLLGKNGITRLRGKWACWNDIPVLPTFHPAYLLRSPSKKASSWHDLLMIRQRLKE